MKPNLERIKEIFSLALQKKSPAERESYLAETCQGDLELRQQVESLLRAQEQAGEFLGQTGKLPEIMSERAGTMIGRYKLLELVGEGGFGRVWMAEQEEPVRRRVALKVIKAGMDTKQVLARFEAERQALAMMDHPSIARVFDGGATDTGRPYFVMELVRGARITDYCDANKLSTRERLALFIQVCQAVQHAHQKGIIHRDLKPSNILVTEVDGAPVPKVIDFGVAKATQARLTERTLFTGLHQMIGTPAYMSPEQAGLGALDMDTRSDIYALGVLLYELLTGQTPLTKEEFEKVGWDEIFRLIREQDPPKPSTRLSVLTREQLTAVAAHRQTEPVKLNRLVSGDLDWIVMKALEKDRRRRYETASGLASDLDRHLNNEPVLARPPSNVYRFQKMVRRNKLVFAAGTAVGAAVLIGLAVSTYLFIQERRAHDRALAAEQEQSQLRREAETESKKAKSEAERAEAAEQEQSQLRKEAETARQYEARLRQQAEADEKKAKSEAERATRAETLAEQRLAESEAISASLMEMSEHSYTVGSVNMGSLNSSPAFAFDAAGRQAAIELQEKMLAFSRTVYGPEHTNTIKAMDILADSYTDADRRDEAIKVQEDVLALNRKMNGSEHVNTLNAMRNLANSYCSVGRDKEAISLLEKACESDPKLDPSDMPSLLTLAAWEAWFGDAADYETTRRRMVQQAEGPPAEGTDPQSMADQSAKACCLRPSTDSVLLAKALHLAQRAVELGENDEENKWRTPWHQLALGLAEYRSGQYAAAERTLTNTEQVSGEHHDVLGTAQLFRAMSLFRQNRPEEARKIFRQAEKETPPLPADERKPIIDGRLATRDMFIWWLAYKEAKSVLNITESAVPTTQVLTSRAFISAQSGRFQEAAADLAQVIKTGPSNHVFWYVLTPLLIQSGKIADYHTHCKAMLNRFGKNTDPLIADRTAKTCLLLPSAVGPDDLTLAANLAEYAVTHGKDSRWLHWLLLTKGLAEYRQSHFTGAIEMTQLAQKELAHRPDGARDMCEAETYFVSAMARHQLNQPDEARAALAHGVAIVRTKLPKLDSGDLGKAWWSVLETYIVMREAKETVEGAPAAQLK
jgi:serine/threonine protein kinase